ncbi:TetR family transcriptional regulator [Gemmiger sp. An120]|uniref:TetR/AcrR family transcriptional regulator n=1 Tax=Gemmiger TaxID=204475 RepID=UPI000B3651AE|nr:MULTISPECIES: TetR/AcrR family transcriptional regulator [Gemmiger]MBM6914524.1 TetR/AcrR family transcriptional regulator [Gemmiger formicilis]OUQ43534.1 TetR family transcriptional regulator [Gemmiger sp. An120]
MPDERESRKERKRQSLLAAAYGLFTEKGVAKTSVDEIVRRANVAKGTFYLYFQDKDQLLQQLVYDISARVLEEAYAWLEERRTPDFVENVLLMLDYIIEYFKRNKLVLRLVERNFSWPMVARQMSERSDPLWDRLMSDLERSPQASRYSEEELFRIIFVIVEMVGSVCYSSIIEGKPDTIDNMKPVLYGIVRNILR